MIVYADRSVTLMRGDCQKGLESIARADVTITDPPYDRHIGENLPGKNGRLADGNIRIRDLGYGGLTQELIDIVAPHLVRVTKRWILVFSDIESSHKWRAALELAGARYVRTGVWVRIGTSPQFSGDRPGVGFETITICHARKGKLRWNGGGHPAVWSYPIVHQNVKDRLHTTPKPMPLMRKLVSLFSEPGELILDPFAGSATTLRAAAELGRMGVGFERDPANCVNAKRRLASPGRAPTEGEQLRIPGL